MAGVYSEGAAIMPVSHAPLTSTIVPLLNDWLAFLKGQAANPVSGQEGLASLSV